MDKDRIMESDPNPFPQMEFFPRVRRVAHFLLDHIRSEGLSDHFRGDEPVLDEDNPDQTQMNFEDQADRGW